MTEVKLFQNLKVSLFCKVKFHVQAFFFYTLIYDRAIKPKSNYSVYQIYYMSAKERTLTTIVAKDRKWLSFLFREAVLISNSLTKLEKSEILNEEFPLVIREISRQNVSGYYMPSVVESNMSVRGLEDLNAPE